MGARRLNRPARDGDFLPIAGQLLGDAHHARRQHVRALGKDVRQFRAQEAGTLSHRDPALQQEDFVGSPYSMAVSLLAAVTTAEAALRVHGI